MRRFKVLFLGKLPPPWIGPTVACRLILNSALKDQFELIHLDQSDHRDVNTLGKVDLVNLWLPVKHAVQLVWLILRHRPALVYIPNGQNHISYTRDSIFILISRLLGRRVICHLRGGNFRNWYNAAGRLMRAWVRFVHRRVHGQIVLGENLRPLFNWILPEERIFVVPNGGDFHYPPVERKDGPMRVLFLGNFIGTKGVLEVLKAAVLLKHRSAEMEFVFAGSWRDAETRREFEVLMAEHPDLPVRVAGQVTGKEKASLLAESDVFLFPTYYPNEGHPWVIVEALAAGLPIISTDHAAISESVLDGVNGFLVAKRSAKAVAGKVEYLLDHPEERHRMGAASLEHYKAEFTEARMVERLAEAFRRTIGD